MNSLMMNLSIFVVRKIVDFNNFLFRMIINLIFYRLTMFNIKSIFNMIMKFNLTLTINSISIINLTQMISIFNMSSKKNLTTFAFFF